MYTIYNTYIVCSLLVIQHPFWLRYGVAGVEMANLGYLLMSLVSIFFSFLLNGG
jgi:hypothetical protein